MSLVLWFQPDADFWTALGLAVLSAAIIRTWYLQRQSQQRLEQAVRLVEEKVENVIPNEEWNRRLDARKRTLKKILEFFQAVQSSDELEREEGEDE